MSPDILIVGAGPAGAWAAYRLARAGARVTVFDPSHPREKPCGGGVTGRALELAGDALACARLPYAAIATARFEDAAPGRAATVPLAAHGCSPASALVVTSRAVLDRALLDRAIAAGARLVAERVVDVTMAADGVEVRTARSTTKAPLVIGADGVNSLVRRRVFRPFTRAQLSIGTGVFARGATSNEIVLRLVSDPDGYIWSFPRPDHLAIGICAQADAGVTSAALRRRAAQWLAQSHLADGARLEPYAWPIPSLAVDDLDRERPSGTRWMLVGDAAGLVDPLTREGIYFALKSADLAAEAIAASLCGAPDAYAVRVRDQIHPELRRAAALAPRFFQPACARLLIDALEQSAAIRDVMGDLVGGRQPYRGLRRRLLATSEFGLAARYAWTTIRECLAGGPVTAARPAPRAARRAPARRHPGRGASRGRSPYRAR